MSTYRYDIAPGYLSPRPTTGAIYHSAHEGAESYKHRRRDDASMKSYHSRSNYARSTHSVETRSNYSYNGRPEITTFDASSTYSRDERTFHSTYLRSEYEPDTKSTHSYDIQSRSAHLGARPTYSTGGRSVCSNDAQSVRSTGGRSSRSKSRTRASPESQQFLNVQAAPVYYRSPSAAGSHRSCVPPSLTHSDPSTVSDDDNESETGRPVVELNTPYTAKVALWRDDVHYMCNDVPPETIIPPHIKAQYEHGRRQHGASPLLGSTGIPSIVVEPCTAPSRVTSPRSTSPPYPLSTPPKVHVSDLEHVVDEIEAIEYEVNSRIIEFTFPATLDFGEKLPNGEFPPLPYTGRNKLLIEHKHYLDKSLLRMDEIQSFNDSRVKGARKRVVTKIQEQLEQLNRMEKMVRDNMHYERWKKTPRIHVTSPPVTT